MHRKTHRQLLDRYADHEQFDPFRWAHTIVCTILILGGCQATPSGRSYGGSYFPETEFADLEAYNADIPSEFAKLLRIADEPIIYDDQQVEFAVRLTIRSSFNGVLIVIAQENADGSSVCRVKKLSREAASGEKNTRLLLNKDCPIKNMDIQGLQRIVDDTDFWAADNKQEMIGSDGSTWILEVKDGSRYHAVYKWWPSDGPVYEIGQSLLRLAGVDFNDR